LGLSRIFWDTNLFIYLLDGTGDNLRLTRNLLKRMRERNDQLITSTFTLGEVLVKPLAMGQTDWAERFEGFCESPGVEMVPFGRAAARMYAEIRADRTIKPPDAIQLACAAAAGTDLFVTNDERLSRKNVRGVSFIVPLRQAYL
jgi:predicted nucleic acid-binding protein